MENLGKKDRKEKGKEDKLGKTGQEEKENGIDSINGKGRRVGIRREKR